MTGSIVNLDQILFTTEGNEEVFKDMLSRLDLSPPLVIKPNWSSSMIYTEPQIIDWILSEFNGEVIVVESHAMWRCEIAIDPSQTRDMSLIKLLRKQKKRDLRKNDEWFLKTTGIQDVLDRYEVEYLNLSEELWAGRVCSSEAINNEIEIKYDPLQTESLSSSVPFRLFELKGGTLLDLAKPKRTLKENFVSLTLKNLFGMIPDPWRRKYHGENEELLSQNIVDINKVYFTLFDVKGVIEGIFSTSETIDNPLDPLIHTNTGYIWASQNPMELDALATAQLGLDPNGIEYLTQASEVFGSWSKRVKELGDEYRVTFPEK